MPYSLLSRFEGCLLGMMWGEQFGMTVPLSQSPLSTWHHWYPTDQATCSTESDLVLQALQEIIRSPSTVTEIVTRLLDGRLPATGWNAETGAIVTLPISLYYHDDLNRQRQVLWQVLDPMPLAPVDRDWIIIFAYAIAAGLRGDLIPETLTQQLMAYYRISSATVETPQAAVLEQLHQIGECQISPVSLAHLLSERVASSWATVPLALLCFLQAPDTLHLALARSAHLRYSLSRSPALCGMVGALAGAYTGSAGVFPSWRLTAFMLESTEWSCAAISSLVESLLASWAGFYNPGTIVGLPAVTAPWVIRQ